MKTEMDMVATRSGCVGSLPIWVEVSPGTEMDMVLKAVFRRRLLSCGLLSCVNVTNK